MKANNTAEMMEVKSNLWLKEWETETYKKIKQENFEAVNSFLEKKNINLSKEPYNILDIGCGNGRHLLPCADRCQNVIGIDISQNLLNVAKKKCVNN